MKNINKVSLYKLYEEFLSGENYYYNNNSIYSYVHI